MQLGLLVLAMLYLSSMGHSDLKLSRQRRISTEDPPSCSSGCERCSEYNGCFKCRPRLFILLERNDIRQMGVCLSSCPVGYYGMRTPETNRCIQCKIENCEACFNRNFCTKCKEGLYSHRGRCFLHCPEGLSTTNGTMECVECEQGEWSAWGPCMKKEKTCGFKKGTQSRVREQAQTPSPEPPSTPSTPSSLQPCSPPTETRRCVVQRTACGKKERKKKGERSGEQNKKGERSGEQKKKEKEPGGRKEGGQGEREGARGGGKKKKGQHRVTTAPSLTTRPSPVT